MRIQRVDGTTLVEVLVATAVFVAGVASLLQLFTIAMAANLAARDRTEAAIAGAGKVEELMALPWGTEAAGADEQDGYARTWAVRPLGDSPATGLAIDVRVRRPRGEPIRLLAVKVRQAP